MHEWMKKRYFRWGLTAFVVVACSILLALGLSRLGTFRAWLNGVLQAFTPLVWGLVIAYILNPVCARIENGVYALSRRWGMKERGASVLGRALGVLGAMILALAVIFAVIMLLVPQLFTSIKTLVDNARSYFTSFEVWAIGLFENFPEVGAFVESTLHNALVYRQSWVENELLGTVQSIMTRVGSGVLSVLNFLMDFLIGLIVAAYMLAGRKRYVAQMRKLNAALWNQKVAQWFLDLAAQTNRVFGGFIRGKILDSIIIGVLCYIGALILRLPYAILVACIVGITNVIPFFGPFIGAIPCAFIILIVSPIKCVYFVIFVFLLQQLDGNFIGPRILGDTTGLNSFWVLVSITVFSGLFGFAGMLLGVPVFAVLYILIKQLAEARLERKGMPVQTESYLEPAAAKEQGTEEAEKI